MEEDLKLDQAVPTLTFEPFTETKKEEPKPEPILNLLPDRKSTRLNSSHT